MNGLLQLLPVAIADKGVKNFIESTAKQPADYVVKCITNFISELKNGPGLVDKIAEQKAIYSKIFQAGISMGFPDYSCVIAASGYAGYSPVDVVTFFRENYGWEVTVEEVEMLGKNLAPKFKEKLIKYGYLKEEEVPESGIPKMKENKKYGKDVPWRRSEESSSLGSISTDSNQVHLD